MTQATDNTGEEPAGEPRDHVVSAREQAGRFLRLALKELREILRDRRTILTLVLMPLLLYPLLSVVYRQFFLAGLGGDSTPLVRVGVADELQGKLLIQELRLAQPPGHDYLVPESDPNVAPIRVQLFVTQDLSDAVRNFGVDVGVRLRGTIGRSDDPEARTSADVELLLLEANASSRLAADFIEEQLAARNESYLRRRLAALEPSERRDGYRIGVTKIPNSQPQRTFSLVALVPLILILMTITGAVYPAIDLTAGERERGTLEILVAAPIPRMGLLLAKYVAVVAVACLTATVNLLMMAITLWSSGLGLSLFGLSSLSVATIVQVFLLLLLFAAFFSAVLLAMSSFARSFKEAQAYLVPLMLVSIAPGMLGLREEFSLTRFTSVVPLVNIVLLARDLLQHSANAGLAIMVVISTTLYAMGAIAVAARIFGAESVLYSTDGGWSQWLVRPRAPRPAPTASGAMLCLAVVFPLHLVLVNAIYQLPHVELIGKLEWGAAASIAIFAGVPLLAAWRSRVSIRSGFRLAPAGAAPMIAAMIGATLLGLSLWPLAHEVVVWQQDLGLVEIPDALREQIERQVVELRKLPLAALLAAIAIVPAMVEELFFRGYLFSALLRRNSARMTILITAIAFGLFHLIGVGAMTFEKLASSTMMGLVLGYVCWASGNIWPGVVLHACHNGVLVLILYFEPWLAERGWGIEERSHLPSLWLLAAAMGAVAGLFMIGVARWLSSSVADRPATHRLDDAARY